MRRPRHLMFLALAPLLVLPLPGTTATASAGYRNQGMPDVRHGATSGAWDSTTNNCRATGSGAVAIFTPSAYTGASINAAIVTASANPGGGIVALRAGTYTVGIPILVKSNVTLIGKGQGRTVIKAGRRFMSSSGPDGGHPLITTSGAVNVTISSLTADQSGDTLDGNTPDRLAAYLIDVRRSVNAVVERVATQNPFTYSIAVVDSTSFCVRDSTTRVETSGRYNQLDGIHVLDSAVGDVLNNHVDQRIGTDGDDGLVAHTIRGPSVHDVRYIGNSVRGGNNGNGMQLAVGDYPIFDLTIQNNEIYDSPFGIRTGYYDGGRGEVHDVTLSNNYIHDIRGGYAFPTGGDAIDIGHFGANGAVFNIRAINNRACRAGLVTVVPGAGNAVSGTTGC